MPRAFEHRLAKDEAEKLRNAQDEALKRRMDLRQRARDKTAKLTVELAAACARPLIDSELLTVEERVENERKAKGTQRWNAAWFGGVERIEGVGAVQSVRPR